MRDIDLAERILRLVTGTERAASTAGDILEEAESRGAIWFWMAVLRTAASLLWRGFTEAPLRLTGLASIGLAIDVVVQMFLASLSGLLFTAVIFSGHQIHATSVWWKIGDIVPTLVVSWLIGRLMARWSPHRELPACLAYAIAGSVFSVIANCVANSVWPDGLSYGTMLTIFLGDAAQRTPVLAGAIWGRQSRLAAG